MHTLTVKEAKGFLQQSIGLIGAKKPYPLLFRTRFGIHTFGVSFPLDILILDDASRIVRMKKALLPNRFYFWSPIWSIVLELPEGTIDQKQLSLGSVIRLETTN